MKKNVLLALLAILFLPAFAVAQEIRDPGPDPVTTTSTEAPPPDNQPIDSAPASAETKDCSPAVAQEVGQLEAEKAETGRRYVRAVRARDNVAASIFLSRMGDLAARINQLRGRVSAVETHQRQTDNKVKNLENWRRNMEGWKKDVNKYITDSSPIIFGDDTDKRNVRTISLDAEKKAGQAEGKADKAQSDADKSQRTADSKADGWIAWLALIVALVAVAIAWLKSSGRQSAPAAGPTPAPAPAPPTPTPPATGPVITGMNPRQGQAGDTVNLDGTFHPASTVVEFVDNNSLTSYPASANVTATQITATVPDVGGITGAFSLMVTDSSGNPAIETFTYV